MSAEKELAKLGPSDFFGEIALLVDAPRTATVRCLETCTVLYATKDMFEEICGAKSVKMVNETTKSDRTDEILAATIGNVSLFAPLSKLEQRKLVGVMGRAKYLDGDYICTEGEETSSTRRS